MFSCYVTDVTGADLRHLPIGHGTNFKQIFGTKNTRTTLFQLKDSFI